MATKKRAENLPAPAASGRAPAPPFALLADDGSTFSLDDARGGPLVLYFYPRDDTPGCTREACAFQEALGAFGDLGARVVGVSRDSLASHQRFKKKYGLRFALLSDPDGAVHRAYGAWGEKTLYGRKSEGCIRTTLILDHAGLIAHRFSPVKVDGHAEAVRQALASLQATGEISRLPRRVG